ncbi:viral A-type inclusion repeat protein [Naegleria gruberi]|uniref:Viral A-type inclusion repeat protein n=1 Tax=Naegleria gruberi TaxID=5762 RepID=D2W2L6_NAEGR|nr:viral A-type inclusion repeat protein [Naegleria gruberi]EFC36670.1 viral A-type inclusion repeat protein [Naegleria gruberi]|eukprot:XP_002669414.1 viral A-type inclusion repeat protein [Naegleria gruberi strain NEG-M]
MTSISNNSSMISSRSSSPPAKTTNNGVTTPMSATSTRSASAFSNYSNSSPSNKRRNYKSNNSNQNSSASLVSKTTDPDDNESMLGYLDQMSQIPSTASPSPLLLPLSTKFKSQKILNTNTPQFQSALKEIKTLKNQAPTKETLRRVAHEIKDKKIIAKLAQLHLDVVEQRRKEAKEQGVTFSEFGATGKVATDDDGNDETLDFIEQVVKRLSEHLEFTKVELFKKVDIITTTDEDVFLDNFKKNVVEKLEKKQSGTGSIIKTDEEIQSFFDERINLVFKFWQQEFVLRLKSSLQLKKEQEMESNKENHDSNLIGIDKHRKLQVENQVLNSLVEKRDKMLEEQRTEYFKEILCLKEELTKLNYQYVPPSYFPENFDAVLTLSFLEDENIKELNQILLQTKNALDDRDNEIRNLLNSINTFQADTFEKLKKHSQTNTDLIEKLMETANAFKFKAQRLYGDNNIPHDQYQSLLDKALQLEKENEKIKRELSALQNIQKAQAMVAMEEVAIPPVNIATPALNKSGSATERSPGSVEADEDDDTVSVTSATTTFTNYTTTTSQAPNNINASVFNVGEGDEITPIVVNPVVSQLKKQIRSKEKRITKLTAQLDEAQAKIKDFEDPEKIKESIMKPLRKYKAYRELIVALETETFILQKEIDKSHIREDDLTRTKNNLLFKIEDLTTRLRELNEWKDEYQRTYVDKTQYYINEIERLKRDMADKDDLLTVQESHILDLSNENIKLNTEITKLLSKISYLRSEISDLQSDLAEKNKAVIPPEPVIERVIETVEKVVEKYVSPPPIERSDSGVQTDFPKTVFKELKPDELENEIELTISTSNPTLSIASFDQTNKVSSRKSNIPVSSRSTIDNNPISSRNPNTNLGTALKSLKPDDKSKSSANTSRGNIPTSMNTTRSTNSTQDITIPSPKITPEVVEQVPKPKEEPIQTVEIDESDPDYDFHKFKTKLQQEEARIKEEQLQKEKEAEPKQQSKSNRSSRSNSRGNSRTNSRTSSRSSSRNTNSRSSSVVALSSPLTVVTPEPGEEALNETQSTASPTTPLNEDTSVLLDATNDEEEEIMVDQRSSSPEKRLHRLASLEFSRGDNDIKQMILEARRKSMDEAEQAKLLVANQDNALPVISISEDEKPVVEEESLDVTDSPTNPDEHTQMIKPERKSVKFSAMMDDNNVNIQAIRPKRRLGTMTLIERLLISQEGRELREHGYNDYYYDENGNLVLKKGAGGSGDDKSNSDGNTTANSDGKSTKPASTKLSVVISKNRKRSEFLKDKTNNNYKYKLDEEELTEEFIRNMDPSHPLYRKFYDEHGNLLYDFNNPNMSIADFLNRGNNGADDESNSRLSPTWNTGSFNGRNNAHGFSTNLARRNRGNSRILGDNNDGFGDLFIGKNPIDGSDPNHTVSYSKTLFSDGSTRNYNGNRRSTSSNGSRPNSSQGLHPGASLTITTPTLFKSLGQHIELSNSSKQKRLEALMKEEQDRLEKVLTSWNQMSKGHPDSISKMKEELLQQLEEEETSQYYDIKQNTRSLSPSKKEHLIEKEFNVIRYTPQNISEILSELGNESKIGLETDSDSDSEEDYEHITPTDYLMRPLLKIKGFPATSKKSAETPALPTQPSQPTDDSLLYDINTLGQLDKLNNSTTTANNSIMNISSINLINIHERNSFNSITPTNSVSPTNVHLVSAPVVPKFGVKGRKQVASASSEVQAPPHIHRIPSIGQQRSKSVATSIDEKPRPSTTVTSRRINKLGLRSESAMDTLEHAKKSKMK